MTLHSAGHRRGVVAAPHAAAVEDGRAILAEGGNAIEAMVGRGGPKTRVDKPQ
jgi:gamma-glutamyltranspeptidase